LPYDLPFDAKFTNFIFFLQAMKMPKECIREEISKKGVLSFARFMELALYCPESGYYETDMAKVGRGGDFITSVSIGDLFGQLLGFQFAEWLEAPGQSPRRVIVEAGAHDGRLASDILGWLRAHRPELFRELKYWLLEPSLTRQGWQRFTLREFPENVGWVRDVAELAAKSVGNKINGIIFSNELLDAFPVHRYAWDKATSRWFEWGVAAEGDHFAWVRMENPLLKIGYPELAGVLPDGYTIECSPTANNWWHAAASVLGQGKLLAIDYGFTDEEQFLPSRQRGTVRAYFRHHVSDDVLANPGEQDLTAHVNFSDIQKAGEAAGLMTGGFFTQAKFLTQILARTETVGNFGAWDSTRARQFQTLTHPEHFGRAFRVLVQARPDSAG
jgi:SAM-dependent MidA family methyltransferase